MRCDSFCIMLVGISLTKRQSWLNKIFFFFFFNRIEFEKISFSRFRQIEDCKNIFLNGT